MAILPRPLVRLTLWPFGRWLRRLQAAQPPAQEALPPRQVGS
jgi:hypothetical protein